jgi:hypothetical protein
MTPRAPTSRRRCCCPAADASCGPSSRSRSSSRTDACRPTAATSCRRARDSLREAFRHALAAFFPPRDGPRPRRRSPACSTTPGSSCRTRLPQRGGGLRIAGGVAVRREDALLEAAQPVCRGGRAIRCLLLGVGRPPQSVEHVLVSRIGSLHRLQVGRIALRRRCASRRRAGAAPLRARRATRAAAYDARETDAAAPAPHGCRRLGRWKSSPSTVTAHCARPAESG